MVQTTRVREALHVETELACQTQESCRFHLLHTRRQYCRGLSWALLAAAGDKIVMHDSSEQHNIFGHVWWHTTGTLGQMVWPGGG